MDSGIHHALTQRLNDLRYSAGKRLSIDAAINNAVELWLSHESETTSSGTEKKDFQPVKNGLKLSGDTQALIAAYNRVPAIFQPDLAAALMRVIDLTISIIQRALDDKSLETQLVREFSELRERESIIDEIAEGTSGSRAKDTATPRGTRRGTQRRKKPA